MSPINQTTSQSTPIKPNPAVFFIPPLVIVIVLLLVYIASQDTTANNQSVGTISQVNKPLTTSLTSPSSPQTPKNITDTRRLAENDLAYYIGPKDAQVTVVEFFDFQCPFCKQSAPIVSDLIKEYDGKSVRFMFRHYPLANIHPYAIVTAQGSICAQEQQAFLPMHDLVYERQESINAQTPYAIARELNLDMTRFTSCMSGDSHKNILTKDITDALDLKLEGTPTFFINGQKFSGVIPRDTFKTIIDSELKKTTQKP